MMDHFAFRVFSKLPLPTYPYRMYMHRHKCIFIHIPKNAGSSILQALGHKMGRDHVEWRHYAGCNPQWFERYHKFAICRHPLDRLYSAYLYVRRGGNGSNEDRLRQAHLSEQGSFEHFILNTLSDAFIEQNLMFNRQYLYVYNAGGERVLDQLLKYETLDEDWRTMAQAQGLPDALPKSNQSAVGKDKSVVFSQLSAQARQKVQDLYQLDFDRFGYHIDDV